jgi:hypothetical protein
VKDNGWRQGAASQHLILAAKARAIMEAATWHRKDAKVGYFILRHRIITISRPRQASRR